MPIRYRNHGEYGENFRSLLADGIRTASTLSQKTWAELSGGLDSSSVVSMAARTARTDLEVISFGYSRSTTADECSFAEEVALAFALPWRVLDGHAGRPFSQLPDRSLPQPAMVSIFWPLYRQYEDLIRSHSVDVVLSGYGGDQVLLGDSINPVYIADWVSHLRVREAWRELRQWQDAAPGKRPLRYFLAKCVLGPIHALVGPLGDE
jgi:asparagine synthetase B (glutamine-hydrolysing)